MKHLSLLLLCAFLTILSAKDGYPDENELQEYTLEIQELPQTESKPEQVKEETPSAKQEILTPNSSILISVVGEGVAPSFARSPAQAYALAKRAATADAYRLIAERVRGVHIDGKDTIRDMAIKRSEINTQVQAMIRNATLVETTFKDGLCEVEMEIKINYDTFK